MPKKQLLVYKIRTKIYLSLLFLVCTFWAQAQAIPVGFIKSKSGFVNTPTGPNPVPSNLLLYLDATRTASYGGTPSGFMNSIA